MKRRHLVLVLLAAAGLALYLWPALRAPVVTWTDSTADMNWARQGIGIFAPAPRSDHPAKPVYLLFLRGAMALAPAGEEARTIVIAQSLLLWASIGITALIFGRRRGAGAAIALYAVLILFLRLRDASSAVMSESLAAAVFLPLAAAILDPPERTRGFLLLGLATAALFWIRPNVGLAALALTGARLAFDRRGRPLLAFAGAFAAAALPFWLATRPGPGGDPLSGVSYPILEASADYYWRPSLEPWPSERSDREQTREELARTRANWKKTLSERGPDARRQIVWRALRGLFGVEFYDARWSPAYRGMTTLSRVLSPFLLAAALALLFVFPFRGKERGANLVGPLLTFLILGQDLLLGPNPRYVLPFLPAVFLLAMASLLALKEAPAPRRLAAAMLFAALIAFLAVERHVLDWQWGMIESAPLKIRQPIPRGALPEKAPATLHVRIATTLLPSNANLTISGPGSRLLYSSLNDLTRERAYVTVALPEWLLEENRRGAVELELSSEGGYGKYSFLLFPVIPPPWSKPARREGSRELSPATGVTSGALDWWAHPGPPD